MTSTISPIGHFHAADNKYALVIRTANMYAIMIILSIHMASEWLKSECAAWIKQLLEFAWQKPIDKYEINYRHLYQRAVYGMRFASIGICKLLNFMFNVYNRKAIILIDWQNDWNV